MKIVNDLRLKAGLTQQELAHRVGTSQPTLAAYESGAKSPTLRTLENMVAALGYEATIDWIPVLTREDRRSLAYHQAVVEKLRLEPQVTLSKASNNLVRLQKQHPSVSALFKRWKLWLKLPLADLSALILNPGSEHRDMRQVSPFAGVLSASERAAVIKRFQRDYK